MADTTTAIDVEAVYRQYGPMVFRRCRTLLRDDELARDAMQDTFVRLVRYQDRLEDRGMSSLLYQMATRVCLNRIRSRKRRPEDASSDLLARIAAAPDGTEGRMGAAAMLHRVFGREPEDSRTIAVMHLLDGFTLQEVADEVGMSVSGVRKRLRKLRASVRELDALDSAAALEVA